MSNDVVIHVRGDTKQAEESITSLTRKITGISNTVTNLIAGGMIAMIGKSFYNAFAEAELATAQLNSVLKSTGGVAGVTSEGALQLADALSKIAPFEDEAILSAENLLLTFTRIGGDIFPQTTKAVLDMSVAMGQDLKSSALQVGKALNEPIEGAAALRRVGVQLTDSQEQLIKKMVEAGDTMGAQKIILSELETEFGGAAEAAGNTLPGALAILRTSLGNIQETIMGAVLPSVTPMVKAFSNWLPRAFAQTIVSIEQLRAIWMGGLAIMADNVNRFVHYVSERWADLVNNILDNERQKLRGLQAIAKAVGDILFPWNATIPKPKIFDFIADINIPRLEGIADTTQKWADESQQAALAQMAIANAAAEARDAIDTSIPVMHGAGAALDNIDKAAKKVAGSAKAAGDSLEELAKKEAARLEKIARETLDLGELLKGAYSPKGFEKFEASVKGSTTIITDEAKATLDDWRRQYTEFNRDIAILFEDLDKVGTQGSEDTVAKIRGIMAGFEALPDELQGPLADIQSKLTEMLEDFRLTSDGAVDLAKKNNTQMRLIEQERIDILKAAQMEEFNSKTALWIAEGEAWNAIVAERNKVDPYANARAVENQHSRYLSLASGDYSREPGGGDIGAVLRQLMGILQEGITVSLDGTQKARSGYRMGLGNLN